LVGWTVYATLLATVEAGSGPRLLVSRRCDRVRRRDPDMKALAHVFGVGGLLFNGK